MSDMSYLNDWTESTSGVIHLMVTPLCNRDCPFCCNKQYDMNSIPVVSEKELLAAHTLCLTGGEPFAYANPVAIAGYYKRHYPNIEKIYVYTNAEELYFWLKYHRSFIDIDGLNVSIKSKSDLIAFSLISKFNEVPTTENRLYIFDNLYPKEIPANFKVFEREWQTEFAPANDSIFRRM